MKRTPLRRGQSPRRKTMLRAKTELRRRVRLAAVTKDAAKRAARHEHQYGPAGYGDWLRSLACVVAGCRDDRIEASHVRSRGAGGDWTAQVPMCHGHHSELHALGIVTFQRTHSLDLADLAAAHALRWRGFASGAGDAEPLVSE